MEVMEGEGFSQPSPQTAAISDTITKLVKPLHTTVSTIIKRLETKPYACQPLIIILHIFKDKDKTKDTKSTFAK